MYSRQTNRHGCNEVYWRTPDYEIDLLCPACELRIFILLHAFCTVSVQHAGGRQGGPGRRPNPTGRQVGKQARLIVYIAFLSIYVFFSL